MKAKSKAAETENELFSRC